ncbi:MAG: acyloxyacyl hydrolase, partial [Candidatus Binatia bacterium]
VRDTAKPLAIFSSAAVLSLLVAAAEGDPGEPARSLTIVGQERPAVLLGIGAFDFVREESRGTEGTRLEGRVELRAGQKLFYLGPFLGLRADHDGGLLGYGGLYFDLRIGRWSVIPAGSLAGYRQGDGKRLSDGEFLFQVELTGAYRLESGIGLGVTFAHVSNGYLARRNPGAESLLATALIPF